MKITQDLIKLLGWFRISNTNIFYEFYPDIYFELSADLQEIPELTVSYIVNFGIS